MSVAVSVRFRPRFSVSGFRFPVSGKNKIRSLDLLFVAVWCFSGFSSGNMHLNRVHVFSVSILIEIYFGFLLLFVRFCGFLPTLRGTIRFETDALLVHRKQSVRLCVFPTRKTS